MSSHYLILLSAVPETSRNETIDRVADKGVCLCVGGDGIEDNSRIICLIS